MKRFGVALLLLFLLGVAVATYPSPACAKDKEPTTRLLTGKVMDHQDHPLQDAVVYLSNTRTHAVKTYIAGPDGVYRFPGLSLNLDYEVYAQYHGHKSDTKTVSQFDDRTQVSINLKIDNK